MSATIELSPWTALKSHQVNCNKGCTRKKVACPVGRLIMMRAMQEPEESKKPMSFPFVARILERVLVTIPRLGTVEAVVIEKSIQPREMYERTDYEDGSTTWRTGSDKLIGYEVMTDDKVRHYVRPYQVTSMRPKKLSGSSKVEQVPVKHLVAGSNPAPTANDLIIRRN